MNGAMIMRRLRIAASVGLCVLAFTGCHWDMWNKARFKPFEPGGFYADGTSSRLPVPGTVPYMSRGIEEHYAKGRINGQFASTLPDGIELNRALLERGRDRFNIYCIVCHGATGDGNGMIVQRGFPNPTSYHIDRLRQAELGYFVDVMTNGFGRMYSYAARVPVEDRWAIAAYIRALQLSQNATPGLVPAELIDLAKNPPAETHSEDAAHGGAAHGEAAHGEPAHDAAATEEHH